MSGDTVDIGSTGAFELPDSFFSRGKAPAVPESIELEGASKDIVELAPIQPEVVEPVVEEAPQKKQLTEAKRIEVKNVDQSGRIYIYSTDCLDCKHLFSKAKNIHNECHFTPNRKNKFKGNEDCPASQLKIELYLPIEKAARAIVAQTISGNMKKVAALYKRLEGYSEEQRNECLEVVNTMLSEKRAKTVKKK